MGAYRDAASRSGCEACAARGAVPWWRRVFFEDWNAGYPMLREREGPSWHLRIAVIMVPFGVLVAAILTAILASAAVSAEQRPIEARRECREQCAFMGGNASLYSDEDCYCRIRGEVRSLK